jgi:3-methyladenine DNA glycosylase AlkD
MPCVLCKSTKALVSALVETVLDNSSVVVWSVLFSFNSAISCFKASISSVNSWFVSSVTVDSLSRYTIELFSGIVHDFLFTVVTLLSE